MANPWRPELQRIAALLLTALLLGALFGSIALGLLIITTGYLAWNLYNVYWLVSWLREGKKIPLPKTGSIWDCVVAHAVTNLLLGIYIVKFGAWHLW